jgi:predicted HicB family RNase H-like nuclease/transcriptional regulator with XRE-family HTH domain
MSAEFRRSHEELTAMLGRSPTVRELASALGVEESDVERALSAERARDSVSISRDGAVELSADSEAVADSEDRLLLAHSVRVLDERERRIVFLRFHADMTERQIARVLGISQAHVSRLLGGALMKLREELARSNDGAAERDTTVVIPHTARAATPRIPSVGGPQENLTLAQYLELPYHVDVRSEQEEERSLWKATVDELPGCASRGNTPDEAVAGLRPAMEAWLTAAMSDQREIPVPSAAAADSRKARSHSGRFLVRMPKSLHEQLARAAEREQVSLNRYVTDALAAAIARSELEQPPAGSEPLAAQIDPAPSAANAPMRAFRVALATNLVVVVLAGLVALVLLVLALQRGI